MTGKGFLPFLRREVIMVASSRRPAGKTIVPVVSLELTRDDRGWRQQ